MSFVSVIGGVCIVICIIGIIGFIGASGTPAEHVSNISQAQNEGPNLFWDLIIIAVFGILGIGLLVVDNPVIQKYRN